VAHEIGGEATQGQSDAVNTDESQTPANKVPNRPKSHGIPGVAVAAAGASATHL